MRRMYIYELAPVDWFEGWSRLCKADARMRYFIDGYIYSKYREYPHTILKAPYFDTDLNSYRAMYIAKIVNNGCTFVFAPGAVRDLCDSEAELLDDNCEWPLKEPKWI